MICPINYSDSIYFNTLCDCLYDGKIAVDHKKVILALDKKINYIRGRAKGYWSLPNGKKAFLFLLETLRDLLLQNVSIEVLRQFQNDNNCGSKICRVLFLVQEEAVWPSLQSVYFAMAKDQRFEPKLVYVPSEHQNVTLEEDNLKVYLQMGLPIVNYTNYNLSDDNPDIVFFAKPYNNIPKQFYVSEVEKIVDRLVYIPYGMEITKSLIFYGFQTYLHYRAWKHIVYGEPAKKIGTDYGYRNGENIVVWGHPKADNYLPCKQYDIPREWNNKIHGRKVVLWCPHHTIKPGPECVSTWLDYYKGIFNLFEKKKDLVLLWRPHPLLFGAIVNNGYMTQSELNELILKKTACENIILDRTPDYRASFFISNAMITDGTTFSIEYLYTAKPLMVTAHNFDCFYNFQQMEKSIYIGKSLEDIEHFVKEFSIGKDPLKEKRIEFRRKMFFIPENITTGEYIRDQILHDLESEEKSHAGTII